MKMMASKFLQALVFAAVILPAAARGQEIYK